MVIHLANPLPLNCSRGLWMTLYKLLICYFIGRRNPFRMLSNAMDFRNRRKVQRPKSADQDQRSCGISANPSGGTYYMYLKYLHTYRK